MTEFVFHLEGYRAMMKLSPSSTVTSDDVVSLFLDDTRVAFSRQKRVQCS